LIILDKKYVEVVKVKVEKIQKVAVLVKVKVLSTKLFNWVQELCKELKCIVPIVKVKEYRLIRRINVKNVKVKKL